MAQTELKVEDRVMDALERLSDKLNTPIVKLYVVMVKQVKVDAINSVILTFFIAMAGFVLKYQWDLLLPRCVPGLQGDGSWPMQVFIIFTILLVITLFWAYYFFTHLVSSIQQCVGAWLNPEGVAFNRIIRYFN